MVERLLALSEMYDLPKRKHLAESQILEAVNPETALHYLVVGSAHRSEWIKAKAVHFVVNDMARIMNTEEWAEVKRANPALGFEVLDVIANSYEVVPRGRT